jgi:transposase
MVMGLFIFEASMSLKMERIDAKRLYLEEGLTIEEIAKRMPNVSIQSLYRWNKEEGWDKEREEISLTSFSTLKRTLLLMSKKMEEMVNSGEIEPQVADSIVKLSKVAERLDKNVNAYGNILLMVEELTNFLAERNTEMLDQLHPLLIEFGQEMGRKYSKKH